MSDNIVPMFGEFIHDEPADEYLEKVKDLKLEECIVIGHTESGELYVGGNISEFERLVFLLFRADNEMKRIESRFPSMSDDLTGG